MENMGPILRSLSFPSPTMKMRSLARHKVHEFYVIEMNGPGQSNVPFTLSKVALEKKKMPVDCDRDKSSVFTDGK